MKLTKMALAAAIATALFGGAAFGQQTGVSTRITSEAYDYYTQEGASPSDKPAEANPSPAVTAEDGDEVVLDHYHGYHSGPVYYCQPNYFTLQGLFDDGCGGNLLSDRNLYIGGSLAQSFTANFDNPDDRFNGPVTWTDRSNDYQLNQLWFWNEKVTDTCDRDFDWGGRVDVMWGTNARFLVAHGLEDKINGDYSFYGMAIPNAYATLAYRDLTVKFGHFVSPIGYVSLDTSKNFFNALPYSKQYGEPFTHTGFVADHQLTDNLQVGGGMTRGWDNFDGGTGLGSPNLGALAFAKFTGDGGSSVGVVGHWSNELNQVGAFTSRVVTSAVVQLQLTENIVFVQHLNYGNQDQALANGGSAQWYGLNNYLFFTLTQRVDWGVNFEWFRDDDGFRVNTLMPPSPAYSFRGANLAGNFAGDFYQVTTGPQIKVRDNLIVRPNVRFDWYTGADPGPGARPFVDGNMNQQVILATDLLWTF